MSTYRRHSLLVVESVCAQAQQGHECAIVELNDLSFHRQVLASNMLWIAVLLHLLSTVLGGGVGKREESWWPFS